MKFGIMNFATEYGMHTASLAAAAEERGFESLWLAEHSHIPAGRESPYPGGGELPQMYYDAMDPFVALAAAAQATTSLKVATGICLVVQRDPIQTAKAVASLDVLSGGRFLFGVGGGWNREEMANHGTTFQGRWKLLRERIEAMKEIWTADAATYHGEHVNFEEIVANPKPTQKPHPPIHVGGAFPQAMRRAVRYGDGWIPISGRGGGDDLATQVSTYRKALADAGRDGAAAEVSMYGVGPDADLISSYVDAGVDRVVFGVLPMPADDTVGLLDLYTTLMDR